MESMLVILGWGLVLGRLFDRGPSLFVCMAIFPLVTHIMDQMSKYCLFFAEAEVTMIS